MPDFHGLTLLCLIPVCMIALSFSFPLFPPPNLSIALSVVYVLLIDVCRSSSRRPDSQAVKWDLVPSSTTLQQRCWPQFWVSFLSWWSIQEIRSPGLLLAQVCDWFHSFFIQPNLLLFQMVIAFPSPPPGQVLYSCVREEWCEFPIVITSFSRSKREEDWGKRQERDLNEQQER